MPLLWYNMYVMVMKELLFYLQIIKPIEEKYNRLNRLYYFFKFNFLKRKMNYYNSLLNYYYGNILNDNQTLDKILKYFDFTSN